AYPLRILNWHEIVNDNFDGPLLVTYCPLCGSGVTAIREVDGEETIFGVSGLLWNSDLVMYDKKTESLWSQILATAVRGPKTGEKLDLLPSTLTTWSEWKDSYPDSKVLLPPPKSGTIVGDSFNAELIEYTRNKYTIYEDSDQIIGFNSNEENLETKTLVMGIEVNGVARAYPFKTVKEERVINDRLDDVPVVVVFAPGNTLLAYKRSVNGFVLRFEPEDGTHMEGGGSRWEITTGRAVDGPHQGERLERITNLTPMFWHAWTKFYPNSTVYGSSSQDG
ncbi:MAG: DUF3179 domain-containing protein, partial [Halobacteria archaeon]|nr:DUF3179 domain-containing protein [Halobacteria archaeon]